MIGGIPISAVGHLALYHNIEVNLREPEAIRIYFTVHAPELPSAVAAGVDPAGVGKDWLRDLEEAKLRKLFAESATLVGASFSFEWQGGVSGAPVDLSSENLEFESIDQLQSPAYDNGLPPGCLLVTAILKKPKGITGLRVTLSEKAEKRLLLAVSRPASFPEVKDLAAGESVLLTIGEK